MGYEKYTDCRERRRNAAEGVLVPRRGLEPPRIAPLVPETSASTSSATWAGGRLARGAGIYAPGRALSIDRWRPTTCHVQPRAGVQSRAGSAQNPVSAAHMRPE